MVVFKKAPASKGVVKRKKVVKKTSIQDKYRINIAKTEVKRVDADIEVGTGMGYSDSGNLTNVSFCAVGTDNFNRIGRTIKWRHLMIKGHIEINETRSPALPYQYPPGVARSLVVYDRQVNGTLPVISDILQNVDVSGSPNLNTGTFKNWNQVGRFLVLRDRVNSLPGFTISDFGAGQYSITNITPITDQTQSTLFDEFIDVSHLNAEFIGTSGLTGSFNGGAFYMVFLGDPGWGLNNGAYLFTGTIRLTYTDS